jgi:uridine kinase
MPLLSPVSAVIFDLDGTIFDTLSIAEPAFRTVVDTIRAEKGVALDYFTPKEVASLIGYTFDQIFELAFACYLPKDREYVHRLMNKAEREVLAQSGGKCYPGIAELLGQLTGLGYHLYLASNCSVAYMQAMVRQLGIENLFAALYPIGRYPTMSDKSELLAKIIEENPQESGFIMIGDREMDITSAKENSIGSIGVLWGCGSREQLASADYLATSPQELAEILQPRNLLIGDLVNYILKMRPEIKGALAVGISGIDNSGKTFLCEELKLALEKKGECAIDIHIDDFHNPKKIRQPEGACPCFSYYEYGFDYRSLEEVVLKPLKDKGRLSAHWTGIDTSTDRRTQRREYRIKPTDIVLVEGVFLFRETLRDYFHLRIFVSISPETCLERARHRQQINGKVEELELLERYRNRYLPGQSIYLEDDRPEDFSQIVIDNNALQRPFFMKHPEPGKP